MINVDDKGFLKYNVFLFFFCFVSFISHSCSTEHHSDLFSDLKHLIPGFDLQSRQMKGRPKKKDETKIWPTSPLTYISSRFH